MTAGTGLVTFGARRTTTKGKKRIVRLIGKGIMAGLL